MAPSGWGKTTLLRILMGLEQPDGGEITGLTGLRISAVFQEDRLCENLNAEANIRLPTPALTQAQALQAMEAVGLRTVQANRCGSFRRHAPAGGAAAGPFG